MLQQKSAFESCFLYSNLIFTFISSWELWCPSHFLSFRRLLCGFCVVLVSHGRAVCYSESRPVGDPFLIRLFSDEQALITRPFPLS